MQVIPVINAPDFKAAEKFIKMASSFLPPVGGWIHIDVGGGKFSSIKTWDKPEEFLIIKSQWPQIKTEVHLMMVDPLNCFKAWLQAGAKRIIVHLETLPEDYKISSDRRLFDDFKKYNAELMLAIEPETSVEKLFPYLDEIHYFQILAVKPGRAGQMFDLLVLEKIRLLRQKASNAKIEVDGGINPETAKLAKEAGADIVVSASYIFNSADPAAAYNNLETI